MGCPDSCPDPCAGVTCEDGLICELGQCVDPCEGVQCPVGSVCFEGNCIVCAEIFCTEGVPFDSNGDGCKDACTNPCEGVTCRAGTACACDPFFA